MKNVIWIQEQTQIEGSDTIGKIMVLCWHKGKEMYEQEGKYSSSHTDISEVWSSEILPATTQTGEIPHPSDTKDE